MVVKNGSKTLFMISAGTPGPSSIKVISIFPSFFLVFMVRLPPPLLSTMASSALFMMLMKTCCIWYLSAMVRGRSLSRSRVTSMFFALREYSLKSKVCSIVSFMLAYSLSVFFALAKVRRFWTIRAVLIDSW